MSCLASRLLLSFLRTESSAHPGVTRLRPRILKKPVTLASLTRHHYRRTLPLLPIPHHNCQITITTAPTLLPKYLLVWYSDVVLQPSISATACTTSPLLFIPSPLHRPRILAVGPPTLLSLPTSCWFIPEYFWSLPPGPPYIPPNFSKSRPPSHEPSSPSPDAGNPRVPPRVFVASLPSTPRFTTTPRGKTVLKLLVPLPPSSIIPLTPPKLVFSSKCYGKIPASPCPSNIVPSPNTWNIPLPQNTLLRPPPLYWR